MEQRNEFEIIVYQLKHFVLTSIGYWYLYLIAFILALGFAKYKNRYSKSIYSIYTTINIEQRYSQPEVYAGGIPITPGVNLENEMGKLTSYQMNYDVLSKLPSFEYQYFLDRDLAYDMELYKSSPIKIILSSQSSPFYNTPIYVTVRDTSNILIQLGKSKDHYSSKFGQVFTHGSLSFSIIKTNNFGPQCVGKRYYIIHRDIRQLAHSYSQRLRIDLRSPNSTILWIWMETSTPNKDIDYLNELAREYINQRLRKKNEIAIRTIEFIDKQLEVFQDSLRVAEKEMTHFKGNNILSTTDEGKELNDELKNIEEQIKTLQLKTAYYNNLLSLLGSAGSSQIMLMPPGFVGIDDPGLQSLMDKLLEAIDEKNKASLIIKDEERIPMMKNINIRIQELRNSIYQYIQQSLKYTNKTQQELEKQRQSLYIQLLKFPAAQREFMQVNRKFEINNKIYTFLMQRRMEAGITLASSRPDAEILDRARPETIRFKRRVGYISIGKAIIFAIVIVLLIISVLFILDTKIKSSADIERLTSIPIISTIIENKTGLKVPVIRYPRSSITEAFRSLRTNILYYMVDKPAKVILISSTIGGEGKTFVSVNLAAILAGTGKKVVILEADLRKPKVQTYFEVEHQEGIVTFLIGEHTYEEIVHKLEIDNLYLIPCGEIPPNPVELLESKKMHELISKLREDFDFVIIDSPPIGIVTDALVLANYSDMMLFVIRQLFSTRQSIKLINELRENKKLEHIAIILNGIKTNLMYGLRYGYGDTYGYGYGVSYGYGYYQDEGNEPHTLWEKFKALIERFFYKLFK